jgi:TonB family protein
VIRAPQLGARILVLALACSPAIVTSPSAASPVGSGFSPDLSFPSATPLLIFSNLQPPASNLQNERPGVPPGPPPATFNITRHGKIIFEADVREPGSSRVALTETVEISGVKSKQDWTDFVSAFVDATSRAWLSDIPPDAAAKKGKVAMSFAVRRDGSLEGAPSIPRSSGDSAIDNATRLAIAKSAPFHELPSSFRGTAAQFRVTFAYNDPHPLAADNGHLP